MNDVIERPKTQAKKGFQWDDYWSAQTYESILPDDIDPKVFASVCKRAMQTTRNLMDCAKENPQSVLNALIECAQDGLMPDGKQAALVCFKNRRNNNYDLTYMPMLRGVIDRLHKSAMIKDISLKMVFEGDFFERHEGDNARYEHKPTNNPTGDPIGVYGLVNTTNGGTYRDWMPQCEIMKLKNAAIVKVGGAKNSYRTPWCGDFEYEMWKKSVLKRMSKILPISSSDRRMLDRDNLLYDIGAEELKPQERVIQPLKIGGDIAPEKPNESQTEAPSNSIKQQGHRAALNGVDALNDWFNGLPVERREEFADRYDTAWIAIARAADEQEPNPETKDTNG